MATQLVSLPEVERLSKTVIRILGGNPGKFTLQGTNTYLVGTGPRRLLIDTGEGRPSWSNNLSTVLKNESATISTTILTHWHHDHVGGIDDLKKLCPSVVLHKNDPWEDQQPITDGQVFKVDGATLKAVHTPGHTTDHMALLLDEEENAMFTGDNVLGQGTAVFEDLATYLRTLNKMAELKPTRGYPGHGPVMEDAKSKILEYIKHRKQREDQVIEVLKREEGKKLASMAIVKVIYVDVPEALHEPARHGVLQVLRKLEEEGKISHEDDQWTWGTKPNL